MARLELIPLHDEAYVASQTRHLCALGDFKTSNYAMLSRLKLSLVDYMYHPLSCNNSGSAMTRCSLFPPFFRCPELGANPETDRSTD